MKIQYGKYRSENVKEIGDLVHAFSIRDVIFNPPATIVYWIDGSKTVVKCSIYDEYDPMVGIIMCVAKRLYGGEAGWASQIRRFAEKGYEKLLINKYPIRPLFTTWMAHSFKDIIPEKLFEEVVMGFGEKELKSLEKIPDCFRPMVQYYPNPDTTGIKPIVLNLNEDEEKWHE